MHKDMHELTLDHLRAIKKLPADKQQAQFQIMEAVLGDKVYEKYGIEPDDLDLATDKTGLESDSAYQHMMSEYMRTVQEIMNS